QVKLEREIAEAQVAKKEWDNIHPNQNPSSLLVLREPQIKQATAELQAANAQLDRAKLDLERTKLSLPFDGRIVRKTIDRGQFISAGQSVATVYGTDVMEIPVPLENSELAWFHLPKPNHNSRVPLPNSFGGADISNSPDTTQTHYPNTASAQVRLRFAGIDHQWTGRVVRTQAHIDPTTRMVYVIVEVDEPHRGRNGRTALLPGMFVDVAIIGKTLQNVIPVPVYAVHNTDEVWIVENNTLRIQKVRIARQDEHFAYVTQGLANNDQVILTPLDTVTHHMKIRTANDKTKRTPTARERANKRTPTVRERATQRTPTAVRERASTEKAEPTGSNP
ncbi:MAG: efflux RND transporter periplasmic adaptor subunit, partial [Planctomycetes bacterium]|nr:efflux RND transporter periplasmic adaptor subunit [Planctomycetota bacterium]